MAEYDFPTRLKLLKLDIESMITNTEKSGLIRKLSNEEKKKLTINILSSYLNTVPNYINKDYIESIKKGQDPFIFGMGISSQIYDFKIVKESNSEKDENK